MKKFKGVLLFLGGMVTMLAILLIIGLFSGSSNNGITWLEEKGECITKSSIEVFQVLEPGMALANTKSEYGYMGKVVLIINNDGKAYYDEQIISPTQKGCIRQVGIYEYQTKKDKFWKTVPVVIAE